MRYVSRRLVKRIGRTTSRFSSETPLLQNAIVDSKTYKEMYEESVCPNRAEGFWSKHARETLTWEKDFTRAFSDRGFDEKGHNKWFEDGQLNVSVNCIDRHLPTKRDSVAFHWEPDDPNEASKDITYGELHREVCRVANALKDLGIGKGDTVSICMPMTPEVVYTMLACARIGAVHSVIFGGFTGPAVASRIEDCQCKVVVTADEGRRAGKSVKLKENVDEALSLSEFDTSSVNNVLVLRRTGNEKIASNFVEGRDVWMHEALKNVSDDCDFEVMDAEDPLFILYTSGSTGKPKGVQHTTAGYALQAAMTHRHVFDYRDDDVYWCTADAGWITGHSYIVYGPLANGAQSVLFEGVRSVRARSARISSSSLMNASVKYGRIIHSY